MLKKLSLQNFRNYTKREFGFSPGTTLIVGDNAVGKTNVLEAIYELATGKSFRAENEREQTRVGEKVSRIVGELDDTTLEIIWDGRERFQKLYRVNGVGKRLVDFAGWLRVVAFSPQDIEIVADSPSTRRQYLDLVLAQAHKDYRLAASIYERALRARNRLLRVARDQRLVTRTQFDYWDKLLIENGGIIHQRRKVFLDFLGLIYDHSVISAERLEKYRAEEVAAAMTLVGPHRDDFKVIINGKNMKSFGSRGEQRLAIFDIKLKELDYVEKATNEKPLLLLDDIFSELDPTNRHRILEVIPKQQTIMTTTDLHLVQKSHLSGFSLCRLPS
ncbi:MAG: AAA family ATPase [Patescibacteria group bacterium]|nr:AAA family ATPase [Patescibacteria group bacterium]